MPEPCEDCGKYEGEHRGCECPTCCSAHGIPIEFNRIDEEGVATAPFVAYPQAEADALEAIAAAALCDRDSHSEDESVAALWAAVGVLEELRARPADA